MSFSNKTILFLGIVICFSLKINLNAAQANSNALNIHVYYESLCPDSRRFIINGVNEAYLNFKDIANIILIPFGKANVRIKPKCSHFFLI